MNIKKNFEYIYSPRTTISNIKEKEEKLFADLKIGFDPYTIKIMKKHYKERLGKINKETFVSILKRHLLTWHPNIPNRTNILIKLLSRLFDEIDLNSNGYLEWEEFVNYIINSSYRQNYEFSEYGLQFYSLSNENFFNHQEENNMNTMFNGLTNKLDNVISYCFYIDKFKLIGIVQEGNSKILFFNSENNRKKNIVIDLVETQNEINKMEIKELNQKTIKKLEKERKQRLKIQNYYNKDNLKQLKLLGRNKSKDEKNNSTSQNVDIKYDIYKIDDEDDIMDVTKSKYNKGLFALTTYFIEEFDLLFISASNNKISAWKYDFKFEDFRNVNYINYSTPSDFHFEKDSLKIPLFMAKAPQNILIYDYSYQCFYSGQDNGKINKWEMNSPYSSYVFDIYQPKNKAIIDNLVKNKTEKVKKNFEMLTLDKVKSMFILQDRNNAGETGKEIEEYYKLEHNSKSIMAFKHKRDTISSLLLIENLRLLGCSFLNGLIVLWDVDTKHPVKVFNDQTTAIYNMVYEPKKHQIFSCGFEHDIFVYEPYNNDNSTYKLKGHNSSVNSLVINPELNELISMDVIGIIKIWDTNNYVNFQTINTNDMLLLIQNRIKNKNGINITNKKRLSSNNYLLNYNYPRKLLVYGSKLLIFEKGNEKNPNLTDDNQLLSCIYNKLSKDLITVSNKRIKMWNIFTGKMKRSYDDLMKGNEITAFTCDSQMKRFYLGDNLGKVKCFNLSTGDFIKEFNSHEDEIVNVIRSTKNELVISCSSDLCIKFQEDKELLTTDLLKEIYARPGNFYQLNYKLKLNVAVLDESNSILTIGLSNGNIIYYDAAHLKFFLNQNEEEDSRTRRQSPIINICDIDFIYFIFVAYGNGDKFFIAKVKNKLYHYLADEKFGNFIDNSDKYIYEKTIILSSSFNYESYSLVTGDNFGILCCYDLKPLYDFMKININLTSEEEIRNNFKKGLNIYLKYKIEIHTESINYLNIPEELEPKIIITTSNDKTVKLIDLKTGQYIDTLKQLSLKYNSIPIGIKYLKENPFIQNVENIYEENNQENNYVTIYKKDIILPLKRPKINYDEANQIDIIRYFDKMTEFNAKMQLISLSKEVNIPNDKSNAWNYDVNIEHLLKKNEEETNQLIEIVNKKENEINKAEKQHQELSLFNDRFNPVFINNLDKNEKNELKKQISMKIRNINLAINKSQMLKKESENIENYLKNKKKIGFKLNKLLKPIKLIKSKNNSRKISKIIEKDDKEIKEIKRNTVLIGKNTSYSIERFFGNKYDFKTPNSESTKNKKMDILKRFSLNRQSHLFKSESQPDIFHNNDNKNDNDIIFNDVRFKNCKNKFDREFKELASPIGNLIRRNKKSNFLPKLSKYI